MRGNHGLWYISGPPRERAIRWPQPSCLWDPLRWMSSSCSTSSTIHTTHTTRRDSTIVAIKSRLWMWRGIYDPAAREILIVTPGIFAPSSPAAFRCCPRQLSANNKIHACTTELWRPNFGPQLFTSCSYLAVSRATWLTDKLHFCLYEFPAIPSKAGFAAHGIPSHRCYCQLPGSSRTKRQATCPCPDRACYRTCTA